MTLIQSPVVHRGTHRALLRPASRISWDVDLDAVIVPAHRRATALHHAAFLAREMRAVLVVLASGTLRAEDAATALRARPGLRLLAIDLPTGYSHPLVELETTSHARDLGISPVDTGPKRTVGLQLARMLNWQRVLFLDDDVFVQDLNGVRRAVSLLRVNPIVGLTIRGYPDHSIVCHAHRMAGGVQTTFVGGGALAVNVSRDLSFFPELYNEDWFFLLNRRSLRPISRTGTVWHQRYDPFARPEVAGDQEFGDVLAEGVFWQLHESGRISNATDWYWEWFLDHRRRFIADVLHRVEERTSGDPRRHNVQLALEYAAVQADKLTPEDCANYLEAWATDSNGWQRLWRQLPRGLALDEVLDMLGLIGHKYGWSTT